MGSKITHNWKNQRYTSVLILNRSRFILSINKTYIIAPGNSVIDTRYILKALSFRKVSYRSAKLKIVSRVVREFRERARFNSLVPLLCTIEEHKFLFNKANSRFRRNSTPSPRDRTKKSEGISSGTGKNYRPRILTGKSHRFIELAGPVLSRHLVGQRKSETTSEHARVSSLCTIENRNQRRKGQRGWGRNVI